MVRLYVNVDHVATLRQQRGTRYPDPVVAAGAVRAGRRRRHHRPPARGPPPHPGPRRARPARDGARRAQPGDGGAPTRCCASRCEVKPDFCTLVPEKREERTTEGGLDVRGRRGRDRRACARLRDAGIGVSLFIDPEPRTVAGVGAASARHRRAAHRRLLPRRRARPEASRELPRLELAAARRSTPGCTSPPGTGSTTPTSGRWRRSPASRS